MYNWHSYSLVIIEEDGSQFSFGIVHCKSKNVEIDICSPEFYRKRLFETDRKNNI